MTPRLDPPPNDIVSFRDITTRSEGGHQLTQYYIELFKAHMSHRFQNIILQQLARQRTHHVRLLSLEEVMQGRTSESHQTKPTRAPVEISRLFLYFL